MNLLQRIPKWNCLSSNCGSRARRQRDPLLFTLSECSITHLITRKPLWTWWLLGTLWLLTSRFCLAQAPSINENFARKEIILTPGIKTDEAVLGLTTSQKTSFYQYYDGLNRTLQTVIVQGSPAKKDFVQPFYYDSRGLPTKSYLPYRAVTTTGAFQDAPLTDQANFYNSTAAGAGATDTRAYSETTFESSSMVRPLSATGVGSFQAGKYTQTRIKVDISNTVMQWKLVSGLPQSTAPYPANVLTYQEATDAEGAPVRTYKDMAGKVVLKQVRATTTTWLNTYCVYNDYDELVYVIPPEAAGNLAPTQTYADTWYYCYQYDNQGRAVGSKAPGADWVYTIYDKWDRPVLTQNGVQRGKSPQEWSFTKYDAFNRPAVAGIFTSTATRATLTTSVASASGRFETRNTTDIGYTLSSTYPTSVTSTNVRALTYYDDYSYLTNIGWDPSDRSFGFVAETGYSSTYFGSVNGLPTGSKSRVSTSGLWFHKVTYYDPEYRPLQIVASHNRGGVARTTTAYNFSGSTTKMLSAYTYTGGSTRISRRFTHDHMGRLLQVYHKINSEPEVLLSSTTYNELGRPATTRYHSRDGGTSWFYYLNYNFTADGKLRVLSYSNHVDNSRLFYQEIAFDQVLSSGNTARYDGLLSTNHWRHGNSSYKHAYHFSYDGAKRLTGSTFRRSSMSTPTVWEDNDFYDETGISYSANGNITGLTRKSVVNGAAAVIDQLSYNYNGNRLLSVDDIAPTASKGSGLKDGNTIGDDYEYDANGNLTGDKNKGITITYNELDLPEKTTLPDGSYLIYYYNAEGTLLSTYYYNSSSVETKRIQRVGELEFENGQLVAVNHEVGRALITTGTSNYQYDLTDYLGSTRVVMQERVASTTVMATMEESQTGPESEQFLNYEQVSRVSADLFNHTPGKESRYALRLSGGTREQTGLARSISVMPGDTVRMEVYGKYLDRNQQNATPALLALLASLPPSGVAMAGAEAGAAAAGVASSGGKLLSALLTGKDNESKAPPAYMNYMFFDKNKQYMYGGFVQLSDKAREDGTGVPHEKLFQEVVVQEPGYLYVYLSNESTTASEAYFDDFSVSVLEGHIVQMIDYYPYGMVLDNWKRTGEKATRELFQGKTYEEVVTLSHFGARQYDAVLGRWQGVDPADQFSSPYTGMGNNPVVGVDPDGKVFFVPVLIGAAVFAYIGGVATNKGELNPLQWNYKKASTYLGIFGGAAVGALTGGAVYGLAAGSTTLAVGVTKAGGALAGSGLLTWNATGGFQSFQWSTGAGGGGNLALSKPNLGIDDEFLVDTDIRPDYFHYYQEKQFREQDQAAGSNSMYNWGSLSHRSFQWYDITENARAAGVRGMVLGQITNDWPYFVAFDMEVQTPKYTSKYGFVNPNMASRFSANAANEAAQEFFSKYRHLVVQNNTIGAAKYFQRLMEPMLKKLIPGARVITPFFQTPGLKGVRAIWD